MSVKFHTKFKNAAVMSNAAVFNMGTLCLLLPRQPAEGWLVSLMTMVTHWSIRWQPAVVKLFPWTAQLLVDPKMAPALILLWDGLLNTSYKIKHTTAKRHFCCYLVANFRHRAAPDTRMCTLGGNEALSISKIPLGLMDCHLYAWNSYIICTLCVFKE